MEDKKLLIVGIDPGTTAGYAVLDIEGNLICMKSSKQLDLSMLISETIKLGKTVLVGTDKAKIPGLVEAFAAKLGAKRISPEEDLKVDEKRSMTNDFDFKDEHQSDALASALFAYKSAKPLLDKIDFFVKGNRKHSISNKIKELVITKKVSIKSAVSIIEKKDEEDQIIDKVIADKILNESDFLKLHDRLKRHEKEINTVKLYNSSLRKRISDLEKQIRMQNTKAADRKAPDFRGQRINFLENLIKVKDSDINQFKSVIRRLNNILSSINNFHILKKLDTLGIKEFNFKNKILHIQRNDMLLVGNPNIASAGVIELLRNKVFIIVNKEPVSKKIENELPFLFIGAKSLQIEEDKYFGFAEKKHFEIEKNKSNWVKKIIDDYKKEKEQLAR